MRYGSSLGQNGTAVQAEPQTRIPTSAGILVKEIPYDYVATFKLTGEPAKRVQDVITISTDGSFVAVSIGYSFVPNPRALAVPAVVPDAAGFIKVNGRPVGNVPPFSLLVGLTDPAFTGSEPTLAAQLTHSILLSEMVRLSPIEFRYSIIDSGSGRELQNQAIHNLAGLGSADGERPFRPFAKPALFLPRSTIRIEIEEISEGPLYRDGTLFIVLHGYKRLGE